MKKILYAVETGGQVYGNQDYKDFTEAYTNSKLRACDHDRSWSVVCDRSAETSETDPYNQSGRHTRNMTPRTDVWNDVVNANWSTVST